MKGWGEVAASEIIIVSNVVKPTILLLLLFFNFNPVQAQFWKFRSNANKIDSLKLVINQDRDSYKKELSQSYYLTTRLSNKLDSLTLKLNHMQCIIDSLAFAEKNTVKSESLSDKESSTDSSSAFCPDDAMLEQVKHLQNCCCLNDEACPNETSAGGLRIIREGYQMAVISRTVVRGSCWDFINRVYSNAGYQQANRETIYKGTKGSKYPTPELLHPGDWVYHVNYSYHNVGHSAIFICWKDYDKKMAVTLSYVGQNRSSPGKYGIYDLSGIYNVMRAKE
jgi:hypothetical protein